VLIVFFPNNVKEEDITNTRVLAVKSVCKEIPVMEGFTKLSHSWGERVGGSAHYSNLYKTSASFQEVQDYYVPMLKEKGFNYGGAYQSARERQISFGKNRVGVLISYNTEISFNLWQLLMERWNVSIHCNDREAYKKVPKPN